jgi:hypothetical protein
VEVATAPRELDTLKPATGMSSHGASQWLWGGVVCDLGARLARGEDRH